MALYEGQNSKRANIDMKLRNNGMKTPKSQMNHGIMNDGSVALNHYFLSSNHYLSSSNQYLSYW